MANYNSQYTGEQIDAAVGAVISGQVGGSGQPIPITLAIQMENTDEIYLYLGNEEGYDYGYIYVYINNEWSKAQLYGKGEDGFSPVVFVTQLDTGAKINITDKDGTTTATIENGTATDAQVAAWLDAHPEATTTVQDRSITPNKTTFIEEPYVYGTVVVPMIRGSVSESTGVITESTSGTNGVTGKVPIDLTKGTSVKFAATGSASIRNRRVLVYNGDSYLGYVSFTTTTDRGTINLSSYLVDGVPTADAICFQVDDYTQTAYISNDPNLTSNTLANLTKTYFDFTEGYKDKYYHALGLDNGGIVTESIADGAITGDKFADGAIQPRKMYGEEANNLLVYSKGINDYHLGGNGQNLGSEDGWLSDYIPVVAGKTYTLNFVPKAFRLYAFYDSSKTVIGAAYTASISTSHYDIAIPSGCAYLRVSIDKRADLFEYGGLIFKWRLTLKADENTPYEYSFKWLKLTDENHVRSSIFRDKIVLGTGDSITENNQRNDNKSWLMYLPEKLGVKVYNDGKSGTGLVKKYSGNHSILYRVENNWDTDYANVTPDIVLIMGNMNDGTGTGDGSTQSLNDLGISGWASTGYLAVGNESDDINTQSVYGCAKRFLEDVITKYPMAKIGWILSTPRRGSTAFWTGKENQYGHGWFEDYITAIKYQCEQYNVPVLDLYHESQFKATNTTNMNAYMDDGTTHPNTAGTKKYLVDPIVKWLESCFGEIE